MSNAQTQQTDVITSAEPNRYGLSEAEYNWTVGFYDALRVAGI